MSRHCQSTPLSNGKNRNWCSDWNAGFKSITNYIFQLGSLNWSTLSLFVKFVSFAMATSSIPKLQIVSFGVGHVLNDLCASIWFSYLLIYFHGVSFIVYLLLSTLIENMPHAQDVSVFTFKFVVKWVDILPNVFSCFWSRKTFFNKSVFTYQNSDLKFIMVMFCLLLMVLQI